MVDFFKAGTAEYFLLVSSTFLCDPTHMHTLTQAHKHTLAKTGGGGSEMAIEFSIFFSSYTRSHIPIPE